MRPTWLLVVSFTVLACKDKQAGPAPAPRSVETGSGAPGSPPGAAPPTTGPAASSAPPAPRLDPGLEFDTELEDKDWATNTERAIAATVPELTEVDCKQRQCRGTLTAATEAELVAKADKLSSEDSLRGTEGAKTVLFTAPTTVDGKLSMQIYVRYDR